MSRGTAKSDMLSGRRSVPVGSLPPPLHGVALDQPGARWELLTRAARCARRGGIILAIYAVLTAAFVFGPAGLLTAATAITVMVSCVAVPLFIAQVFGLAGVIRRWRFLGRQEWRVYDCQKVRLITNTPTRITIVDRSTKTEYNLRLRTGKPEALRRMIRPQVWFAGDPQRWGILVMAGGGEMFTARAFVPRPPKPVKARKPSKPRKPPKPRKPVTVSTPRKPPAKVIKAKNLPTKRRQPMGQVLGLGGRAGGAKPRKIKWPM